MTAAEELDKACVVAQAKIREINGDDKLTDVQGLLLMLMVGQTSLAKAIFDLKQSIAAAAPGIAYTAQSKPEADQAQKP